MKWISQRDRDCLFEWSRTPEKSGVSHSGPESSAIRTARDKADHLPHPGFSSGTREPAVERRNETSGKPPSPAKSRRRDRVLVVVRMRESRVHGEGGQSMSTAALSLG
jgi:hypothetical protein